MKQIEISKFLILEAIVINQNLFYFKGLNKRFKENLHMVVGEKNQINEWVYIALCIKFRIPFLVHLYTCKCKYPTIF